MPYSEHDHSRPVASILSTSSHFCSHLEIFLFTLRSDMRLSIVDLNGKLAIVTGASSGIGFEVAQALAGMGARVVLACRSENKGQDARQRIIANTGNEAVELEIIDCEIFNSVAAFIDRWGKREQKQVDILINNAGTIASPLVVTQDGFEQTYQTNHLSHVMLTHTLLNRGWMASDARIVSVSSRASYDSDPLDAHNAGGNDLLSKYQSQAESTITIEEILELYSRSKASQVVWTIVLQNRLSQTERWKNISVHSCHPGTVGSSLWDQPTGGGSVPGWKADMVRAIMQKVGISNLQGAMMPVWLATSPEPALPELRGMYWDRLSWRWVKPWCLEGARQEDLWRKWCEDAHAPLLI